MLRLSILCDLKRERETAAFVDRFSKHARWIEI